MPTKIPAELSKMFTVVHFEDYPLIKIPQTFTDGRGTIMNIADGSLGDVAFITSLAGSIRANHFHKRDWHLTFLIAGEMNYEWQDPNEKKQNDLKVITAGQLIFTPPNTPHRMTFMKNSTFIAISRLNRSHEEYSADTIALEGNFF
jgi:oxalate decarboxylase/phosphoglucose isomerase-like protein (cupin superfamily)